MSKPFGDMDVENFKQKKLRASEQSDVDAVRARFETFDDWFFKEPYRAKYRSVYNKSDPVYMSAKEAWDYQAGIAAHNEWISVKDRLPDAEERVYVIMSCRWNNDWMTSSKASAEEITHWMPLPPKP